MKYVIFGVAAVLATVNWLHSPSGRAAKYHFQAEQAQRTQLYERDE